MITQEPLAFAIQLNPVTKKNSQQIIQVRGKRIIVPSKAYRQCEKDAGYFLPHLEQPIDFAVNVKALYYMKTRRRVDLANLNNALHDVLVKHGVLVDDNSAIIASTDGSRVLDDKERPRTEVEIVRVENGY